MHVDYAGKPGAVLVAEKTFPRDKISDKGSTYVLERYAAIMVKISVSLRVVSSNPGVSIRITTRPSTKKGREICTSLVQLSRPRPTGRLDPLAVLINFAYSARIINAAVPGNENDNTYRGFTTPGCAHDARMVSIRLTEGTESAYAILISLFEFDIVIHY